MSTSLQGLTLYAANAGEDLSAALFKFARVHTDGTIKVADGATSPTIGVIIEGAALGAPASVQCDGIGKVTLAAALTAGVAVVADGHGLAADAASAAPDGVLLSGGDAGDVVTVRLRT